MKHKSTLLCVAGSEGFLSYIENDYYIEVLFCIITCT
jgi:hypothetical protein